MKPIISLHRHLLTRGRTLVDLGLLADARVLLERLLVHPDAPIRALAEARRLLGEIEFKAQRFAKARNHFREAIRHEPEQPEGYFSYAVVVEADPNGDLERAYKAVRRATRLEPTEARYWVGLGQIAIRLGLGDKALAAFRRAVALNPAHVGTIASLIEGFFKLDCEADAAELMTALRFRYPNDPNLAPLWDRFRFERARRAKVREAERQAETILPFTIHTEAGETVRLDGPSQNAPHFPRWPGRRAK